MDSTFTIQAGSTDVTLPVLLFDATTGEPKTGITETNLDMRWIRVETDNDVTLEAKHDLIALATPALTDAHLDYGCEEIGLGYYRVDLPDAICATGANYARVVIFDGASTSILQNDTLIMLAPVPANAIQISGDSTAADNLELAYDGTGYTNTNNSVSCNITSIDGHADAASALEKAAKLLGHKTSQAKATGTITIYNAAGTAAEYTKTQTNAASTLTFGAIS